MEIVYNGAEIASLDPQRERQRKRGHNTFLDARRDINNFMKKYLELKFFYCLKIITYYTYCSKLK